MKYLTNFCVKNNFVFDTNALVSAVLSPRSTNAQALRKARRMGVVVYSDETWEELSEVLFRAKFDRYFTTADRQEILNRLQTGCKKVIPQVTIAECRDADDDKFLELAVTASAAVLVTGDPDLLVLHPFRNTPILNAAGFLRDF